MNLKKRTRAVVRARTHAVRAHAHVSYLGPYAHRAFAGPARARTAGSRGVAGGQGWEGRGELYSAGFPYSQGGTFEAAQPFVVEGRYFSCYSYAILSTMSNPLVWNVFCIAEFSRSLLFSFLFSGLSAGLR